MVLQNPCLPDCCQALQCSKDTRHTVLSSTEPQPQHATAFRMAPTAVRCTDLMHRHCWMTPGAVQGEQGARDEPCVVRCPACVPAQQTDRRQGTAQVSCPVHPKTRCQAKRYLTRPSLNAPRNSNTRWLLGDLHQTSCRHGCAVLTKHSVGHVAGPAPADLLAATLEMLQRPQQPSQPRQGMLGVLHTCRVYKTIAPAPDVLRSPPASLKSSPSGCANHTFSCVLAPSFCKCSCSSSRATAAGVSESSHQPVGSPQALANCHL
jgi:hypothetical protein